MAFLSRRTLIDLVLTIMCWAAMTALLALQLAGAIHWPWWWIVAPLWLPVAIAGLAYAAFAMLERTK